MARVPGVLSPYVTSVVAYDMEMAAPGVHRGLPSTGVTLVLPIKAPLEVSWPDRPGSRRCGWSTLAGLHTRPAAIHHSGRQSGVQVALTPAGSRALLGVPAGELASALLTLEEVAPSLADLPERLATAPPATRAELVVDALLAQLARRDPDAPRPEVDHALTLLAQGSAVARVADDVGLSRRRLSTLVGAECGVTPKGYQRVARFQRARSMVGHRPLAEVAAVCSYADQAHLTREWSELAGCSPTTWLREEFPFLQDPLGGGARR